jgi:hypothetical protein
MAKYISLFLLLTGMTFFVLLAPVQAATPKTNTTNSFATQPTPNQVIVKYKKDLSPQALQLKVDERKVARSSTFGSVRLFFENLKYKMAKQALPEDKLARIQAADEKVGAKNKTRIFDANDENQRNLFVIELDPSKSIEDAIKTYEALPEVEYAEPNYTFHAF